jgi:hypothetical protein
MNYNMFDDIKESAWMRKKIQNSDSYAQNLYAACCNNSFQKLEVWTILRNVDSWACSWRTAGGYIAEIRNDGDYMDWYCSGIQDEKRLKDLGYVPESAITEEIKEDLRQIGWVVKVENE